jgi:transcriptional regulator with XRE-family HTH domain
MARHNWPTYEELLPLARRLRAMRERTGLSIEEATLVLGLEPRQLVRLEAGRKESGARLLMEAARVYSCPVGELFEE